MHEHDIEGELDAALARYAAVEPRDGLEQRVFANLQVQHTRASRIGWQHWIALGFAAASLAALAIWAGGHSSVVNVKPIVVHQGTASTGDSVQSAGATKELNVRETQGQSQRGLRRNTRAPERAFARSNAEAVPTLARFPAPEPLSEQEKLLVRYVEQSPKDAVLVAEAMNLESQRELDEMKALNKNMQSQQEQ